MDTMATRSSEPVTMIPFIFLKDNFQKNPFFGCFYTALRLIKIRPAPDPAPAFSGSMKISCLPMPLTICFLQKQGAGAIESCSPVRLGSILLGWHSYSVPEV
jgi:hypothetical protein